MSQETTEIVNDRETCRATAIAALIGLTQIGHESTRIDAANALLQYSYWNEQDAQSTIRDAIEKLAATPESSQEIKEANFHLRTALSWLTKGHGDYIGGTE